MKRYLTYIFIASICISVFAENLQERRVYYLDCSYSMVKPNKIWDKVCDNLIKAIDAVEDENTELWVIPFAVDGNSHSTLTAYKAKAYEAGKEELKKKIKAIIPSVHSMTYHSDPIRDFYDNNRVNSDKITYMFLMTDGENEDKDPNVFYNLLSYWKGKFDSKNVYGFYVMLNHAAYNKRVEDIIDNTNHLWQVETADININLIRLDNNCKYDNRSDDYIDIPISGNTKGIKLTATGDNNHYEITKSELQDEYLRVYIQTKPNVTLPQEEILNVNITPQGIGKFDFLITPTIDIKCLNKPIKSIRPTFNKGKKIEKLGMVKYYPKFWWKDEQTTPLITILHLNFNDDAKANGGFAEFEFVDNEGNVIPAGDLTILRGGEKIKNNRFKVDSNTDSIELSFSYASHVKGGKKQGFLRLVNHNIEQDGNTELVQNQQNNSLKWQIRYEKNMNPFAKNLMCIGIFVGCCLLFWFLVIKPIKYPTFGTFKKSLLVSQGSQIVYNRTCQFKGAKMVVFATQKEKQPFFNRLFTGRIVTYTDKAFTQKIVFVPKKQGRFAFVRAVGYTVTPNPIPRNGVATIKNNQIEIKLT